MNRQISKAPLLSLTIILVKDAESSGFTAFFAQFPNIIAEGDTDDDATSNLINLVKDVFKHQEQEEMRSIQSYKIEHKKEFKTRSVNLAFA